MSVEHNQQEERPGAFLSLSGQAPPLSLFPSRKAEAMVETCILLQQPGQSQGAARQQAAVACVQPSVSEGVSSLSRLGVHAQVQEPSQHTFPCLEQPRATSSEAQGNNHGLHTLACGQNPQPSPHGGQCEVGDVKESQYEYTSVVCSAQHMLDHAQESQPCSAVEQCAQYLKEVQEKHATSTSCPKASGQYILAYAQASNTLGQRSACLMKESSEMHKLEASSEELKASEHQAICQKPSVSTEEQKLSSQKDVVLEHPKASNLQHQSSAASLLEQQKGSTFVGFSFRPNPSSLHPIQEQQHVGHVIQPHSGSLQGQQNHSFVKPLEKQKLPPPQDGEKPLSQQGHKVTDARGPHSSSLELDQQSLASHELLPFKGPSTKRTAALYPEDQRFSICPRQSGSSIKHDLADLQSNVPGSSLQECFDKQKRESFQEFSPAQGSLQQNINQTHSLLPQQVFKAQPSPAVLSANGGILYSDPIVMSDRLNQDGVCIEREHPAPTQSLQGLLASPEQVYPAPLATNMAVLTDERLFTETLRTLNAALGLQVRVPKIGEIALNLHKLYKEVTCRGGLEMVTKNKKWNEVTNAMNFPASVTDLKNSYTDVLYHYEQVYFWRAHATCVTQSEQEAASVWKHDVDAVESEHSTTRKIINTALEVDPASSIGVMVRGAIDGKFENGYLVTVMVGAQKLSGVLYHVASTNTEPQNACVQLMIPDVSKLAELAPRVGRKRKKTEVNRKDPNAPRQNRSGYNFFFAEQRAKLKTMQPDKDRATSKKIGELWNRLSEDEKTPYQEKGIKDKERYVREMKEYKEKIQVPVITSNYSKVVLSRSPSTHTPGSSHDCTAPCFSSTCMSEASRIVLAAQLPSTCTVKALNDSEHAPALLSNAAWSADKKSSIEYSSRVFHSCQ